MMMMMKKKKKKKKKKKVITGRSSWLKSKISKFVE
jgi:hypothetical protein